MSGLAALAEIGVLWSAPPAAAPSPGELAPEVIAACRRGDRGALDRVLRAQAAGLERLLARMVGPRADVEDLLQETFAAAITAFPRFRGEAAVKTWLHQIAINVAHKFLRSPRHRREQPLDEQDERGVAASAEHALDARQRAVRLYIHLDRLDPAKRIALLLFTVEELSIAEIAALTGASRTATKSRLFWARRALLQMLRDDPAFPGAVP